MMAPLVDPKPVKFIALPAPATGAAFVPATPMTESSGITCASAAQDEQGDS
jgi:hypothetical protein